MFKVSKPNAHPKLRWSGTALPSSLPRERGLDVPHSSSAVPLLRSLRTATIVKGVLADLAYALATSEGLFPICGGLHHHLDLGLLVF